MLVLNPQCHIQAFKVIGFFSSRDGNFKVYLPYIDMANSLSFDVWDELWVLIRPVPEVSLLI